MEDGDIAAIALETGRLRPFDPEKTAAETKPEPDRAAHDNRQTSDKHTIGHGSLQAPHLRVVLSPTPVSGRCRHIAITDDIDDTCINYFTIGKAKVRACDGRRLQS